MSFNVVIVDYGVGNLLSVQRAFVHIGANVQTTDKPEVITAASRLVLPGVGAFGKGMDGLRRLDLVEAVLDFTRTGQPFLGICLGMQMMMDESEEFGYHQGLGLIPGKVVAIPETTTEGNPQKRPHIGWNPLVHVRNNLPIMKSVGEETSMYFVHSFAAQPSEPTDRLVDTYYNGHRLAAVIGRDNLIGTQFHPEKSGEAGLSILRNFISL